MMCLTASIRVGTLNVRGLSARRKQCQIWHLIEEKDLDILAIQETKVESGSETELMVAPFSTRYKVCVSHAIGTSAGCAIFLKKCLGIVENTVVTSLCGRFVLCDFTYEKAKFRIICVFAPTDPHDR